MRVLLFALSLAFTLAACGGPSGPTTPYDNMGIQATLPGDDWQRVSESKVGSLTVDTWQNADKSLIFRVSTDPDEALRTNRVQSWAVDEYMSLMDYPVSSIVNSANLRGYRTVRLEAAYPDKAEYHNEYHMVEHVFVAALRHYYVGAGAINATWNSGGRDAVDFILLSVKIYGK